MNYRSVACCILALGLAIGKDGALAAAATQAVVFAHGQGLKSADGKPLHDFAIAGANKTFVWADALIEGDTVVVRSSKVPDPEAVRYDWADAPHGNLENADGLPAAPFRTDTFTPPTFNNR